MTEKIHYVKADPSGNTTILVLDAIPKQEHASLAARLLQPEYVGAEQVGFLTWPDNDADIRLDMMGNEFCGNASRSAAAYLLSRSGQDYGEYRVSCSGCNKILKAVVVRDEGELYNASIEVPLPKKMDVISLADGNSTYRFYCVELPGIMHFVHFTPSIKLVDKNTLWRAVYQYASTRHYEAFGMDLVDRKTLTMIPAVYVTGTDTLYWEKSCGSGSAATAAALARLCGHNIACEIRQPGGSITIEASYADQSVRHIRIGGPVRIEMEQCVCVDKEIPGTV